MRCLESDLHKSHAKTLMQYSPACTIHRQWRSSSEKHKHSAGAPDKQELRRPPHPTTPCTLTPLNSFFTSCVKGQPELREAQLAVHYGSNRAHRHLCSGEMGLFCSQLHSEGHPCSSSLSKVSVQHYLSWRSINTFVKHTVYLYTIKFILTYDLVCFPHTLSFTHSSKIWLKKI